MTRGTESMRMSFSLGTALILLLLPGAALGTTFSHHGQGSVDIASIGMPASTTRANIYGNNFGDNPGGIPLTFFAGFPHMEWLYLYQNNLDDADLQDCVFSSLGGTLTYLHLAQNDLTIIRANLLKGLHLLEDLRIDRNEITTIESGTKSYSVSLCILINEPLCPNR